MSMSLAETASVLDELCAVFAADDDQELARNVIRTRNQIDDICLRKEHQISSIIQDLMNEVSKLQKDTEISPEKPFLDALQKIEAEKTSLQAAIADLEKQRHMANTKLMEVLSEDREIEQIKNKELKDASLEVPQVKHLINLYSCITRVTWDYDNLDDVKGHVVLPKTNQIKPFHFRASDGPLDQHAIADALWDIMWLDHATSEATPIAT